MDDHLRSKRQGTIYLDSSHITSTYDGVLRHGNHPFGRPGGYVFGTGSLSPNAHIPVPAEFYGPPEPEAYEKEVNAQLQATRDRIAQAAPQIHTQAQADIDGKVLDTGPLVDISPVGQIAARLVVIDSLMAQTSRSSARWQAGTTQFFGRDIWQTTAQDFTAHVQAAGQFGNHRAAQRAARQWRESLAAAEQVQKAGIRVTALETLKTAAQEALQIAAGQAHGQDPTGWQQQINSARTRADELIAELPNFLHAQVISQPQINGFGDPGQYLLAIRGHIEALLAGMPPLQLQPGVDSLFTEPPLGKPEMEALLLIVESDRSRGLNSPFSDAREAVLRNESIRHLKELAVKVEAIRTSTVSSQQRLSEHTAQQARLAAELERQAAAQRELQDQQAREEAEAAAAELEKRLQEQARQAASEASNARLAAWRAMPGALVVDIPQLQGQAASLVAAGTALTFPDTAALSLRAAVRAAIGLLGTVASNAAASASVLLSGLAVGFIVLLWPSSLGNSERRGVLMMPLDTLPSPDSAALDAAAQSGQPVSLPYAATLRSEADGLRISVVAGREDSPLHAQVIDLMLNAETGAYLALIDTPPRLIQVTPVVQPGDASTELPITDPLKPALPGPSLELQGLTGNVTPGYEALDAELYILRYPANTGLPTLYLAVERPPVELGEVGRYEELAQRSKGDGLDIDHVPSGKALEAHYLDVNPQMPVDVRKRLVRRGASVTIPREIHQKHSETYGGRNTKDKSLLDGANLEAAVNSNINAYRPALIESGMSTEQITAIIEALHEINRKDGLYE
jgi:hypothetical protein